LDPSAENVERVRQALKVLPDQAVLEVRETDLDEYQVVRVADEIVVDLMSHACGVRYEEAKTQIVWSIVEGVHIPFASAELLWKLKQAPRAKDELDRMFLQRLLHKEKPPEPD
jgi:cytochrome P450